MAWLLVSWINGKPSSLGFVSGAVAGLVAITPGAGYVTPLASVLIGAIGGVFCYGIMLWRIRSGLDDALTALRLAEYNFSNTRLYAPISGAVANLEALQWNPSQDYKNLCTIINDQDMEVEFPVIESEFSFLNKGMPVGIIPFINDSTIISGRITQINPQVDESGMIKVRAELRNNGLLIDGMNVKVVIRKPVSGRLVVPKEALVIRQGKDVIFVRQDTLAIWKYVTVEAENSTSVSIKEGLEPGDLVIVSGNVNLAHETVVKEE